MGKSTDLAVPVEGAQPETLSALKKCQMPLCITQPSGVKGDMSTAVQVKPYSPHALKPIPSRVLTEDDYVGILEMIIQRDFFPDLPVLSMRMRIAESIRRGDPPNHVQRLERMLGTLQEDRRREVNTCSQQLRRVLLLDGREFSVDISRLSLTDFQSLFTSEDNASFEKIVRQEKLKLAAEQAWMEQAAVAHNVMNEDIRAALGRGERPAQLLYGPTDARNPLVFPLTDETAGVVGLYPGKNGKDVVAVRFKNASVPSGTGGEVVPVNTRLEREEELLCALSKEQTAKQERLDQKAAHDALFDVMVQKGVYSAKALADLDALEAATRPKETRGRKNFTGDNGRFFQELKTCPMTPAHNGYSFLRTPVHEGQSQPASETPMPTAESSRFQIPDLSKKELAALHLSNRVSQKIAAQKSRAKTASLRDVLRGSTTPSALSKTPKDLFGNARFSGVSMLRQHSSNQRTPAMTPILLCHRRPPPPCSGLQSSIPSKRRLCTIPPSPMPEAATTHHEIRNAAVTEHGLSQAQQTVPHNGASPPPSSNVINIFQSQRKITACLSLTADLL